EIARGHFCAFAGGNGSQWITGAAASRERLAGTDAAYSHMVGDYRAVFAGDAQSAMAGADIFRTGELYSAKRVSDAGTVATIRPYATAVDVYCHPHQLLADWHWLVRHVCGVYSRLCFSVLTCADGPYRRYAGLFTYRVSTALEFDDD